MAGSWGQHLQDNLNIDKQIHNLANLLYSNRNRSSFGHSLCDLSQDRQLSGLPEGPSSCSILASDPTRDVHTKIYSLNKKGLDLPIISPLCISVLLSVCI